MKLTLAAMMIGFAAPGVINLPSARAEPIQKLEIFYAPGSNLEAIDVRTISGATKTIDMAAYVLTDWPIMDALREAAQRGVAIRIVLDGGQFSSRETNGKFEALARAPGVLIRLKRMGGPYMHLKAYAADRQLLRTGSANFTASGLKQQNNDLVLIADRAAAEAFTRNFETIWSKAEELK
jgi:phosphatidylserine/phosphatidylglycerophosphate/cardiolipin synthase-like enzyme